MNQQPQHDDLRHKHKRFCSSHKTRNRSKSCVPQSSCLPQKTYPRKTHGSSTNWPIMSGASVSTFPRMNQLGRQSEINSTPLQLNELNQRPCGSSTLQQTNQLVGPFLGKYMNSQINEANIQTLNSSIIPRTGPCLTSFKPSQIASELNRYTTLLQMRSCTGNFLPHMMSSESNKLYHQLPDLSIYTLTNQFIGPSLNQTFTCLSPQLNQFKCGALNAQGFPSALSSQHFPSAATPGSSGAVNPLSSALSFNLDKSVDKYEAILKKLKLDPEEKKLARSLLAEVLNIDTNVKWDDIAGLTKPKQLLFESLVLPSIIPHYFDKLRKPWKGVLLVGPPGTGKTMLAKAAATETKSNFFNMTSSGLTSKWYGESEKLIRLLFLLARELSPSIIFFDEFDSMCSHRSNSTDVTRRIKSELLCQMDGLLTDTPNTDLTKSVLILAATNFPWDIDEAFRRRLEKRIYVPLPDFQTRLSLLEIFLRNVQLDESVDLSYLAQQLDGYSSADITIVCRDAAFMNIRHYMKEKPDLPMKNLPDSAFDKPITKTDFDDAVRNCPKTVKPEDSDKFSKWIEKFGSQ